MRFHLALVLSVSAAVLLGCSDVSVPSAKSATGRLPTVAEVPEADETVRGADDPAIVTLETTTSFKERRLSRVEELPGGIIIPNTNLNAVPVTAALQAVLAGTDVSLSWDTGNFESRLVSVTNLSGPLPQVVEKICASARVFCGYRRGLLELREKETFIIDLPSVPSKTAASSAATNTMADTISELAGEQVKVDQQGGNLLYTTDVDGYEHVHEYLTQLRHGRPLVVMQLYIWEVTLEKDKGTGINWTDFDLGTFGSEAQKLALSGSTAFSSLASPGVSLGATFSGKVDAEAVLKFLSSQGQVQTISNPQLTFISGSNAEFRVGGKQRYISEVGSSSSVSSSTSSSTSNTVSTDSIDTGLTVKVNGVYESGVISAMMELELQDVVSLNATTMENGTTIDLPETSERNVTTSIRVRPGDNLVLAGLVTARDVNDRDELPLPFGMSLPSYSHDQLKNSELVILVKPAIVKFADAPEEKPPVKKKQPEKQGALNGQDAFLIDKDGVQTVKMPESPTKLAPVQVQDGKSSAYAPELMQTNTGKTENLTNIPIAPSPDGAPVDRRLLQRGFSYAYDDLQQPATGNSP